MKYYSNLTNGVLSDSGVAFEIYSPIDKKLIGTGYLLEKNDLSKAFENTKPIKKGIFKKENLIKLSEYIKDKKNEFIEQITLESGYLLQDSKDIVEGTIELTANFMSNLEETEVKIPTSTFSYVHDFPRELKIINIPYGVVSIMTPQNAPLILELTALLNALAAGNGIVLRPSSQNVGTASMMIDGLLASFPKEITDSISIVSCKATDFLHYSYRYSSLIHYIGSSVHGKNILKDGLQNSTKVLVDGEGSSIVVIDKTVDIDKAVQSCRDGIIRCSGELCSTVRTILVDKEIYEDFKTKLTVALDTIKVGDPFEKSIDMGPLFNEKQVENIVEISKKYSVITNTTNKMEGNYLSPILCELKIDDSSFVNESFYGPLVGIVSYEGDEWKKWFTSQKYQLNSCVFSTSNTFIEDVIQCNKAPRLVINHDPSIESAFEPWGAFLPCGQNEVSYWISKYQNRIQLDKPIDYENK